MTDRPAHSCGSGSPQNLSLMLDLAGEARFIGSVPTPWPSWMIAAHAERTSVASVAAFLTSLTGFVNGFNSEDRRETGNVSFIEEKWGYKRDDIQTVDYPRDCAEISSKVVLDSLSVLTKAGALSPPEGRYKLEKFVNMTVARVVTGIVGEIELGKGENIRVGDLMLW